MDLRIARGVLQSAWIRLLIHLAVWLRGVALWMDTPLLPPLAQDARRIVAQVQQELPETLIHRPLALGRFRFTRAVQELRQIYPDVRTRDLHFAIEQAVQSR